METGVKLSFLIDMYSSPDCFHVETSLCWPSKNNKKSKLDQKRAGYRDAEFAVFSFPAVFVSTAMLRLLFKCKWNHQERHFTNFRI